MASPSAADIKAFLQANMGSPGAISGAMQQYGVTLDQIQGATGYSRDDIGSYINNSGDAYLKGAFANWATPTPSQPATVSTSTGSVPATSTSTGGLLESARQTTTPVTPTTSGNQLTNDGVRSPGLPAATPAPAADTTSEITKLLESIKGIYSTPIQVNVDQKPFTPTAEQLAGISASGNAAKLVAAGSPLLQSVQNQALAGANRRGLLNSSAAQQAAMEAALAEAGRLGSADASNYLGLTTTGLNNDAALQRELLQGQFGERLQTMRDNAALTSQATGLLGDQLDFARRDAASVRDSNVGWQRDLDRFMLETTAGRENQQRLWDRADTLATGDRERALQQGYANQIGGLRDSLAAKVSAIQNSELPPDVKEAQITSEIAIAREWVNWTNEIYQALPEWKNEWAQFDVKVG